MSDKKNDNIIEKDLSKLFGFDEMSDDEKITMLDDIGSVVLENAILRFVSELEEEKASGFESYTEVNAETETFIEDLLKAYPRLEELVVEEAAAFKKEAVSVLEK